MKKTISFFALIISTIIITPQKTFCEILTTHEQFWTNHINMNNHFGTLDTSARFVVRNYIVSQNFDTLLDIPCGRGRDYQEIRKLTDKITYYGMDITPKFIEYCKELGMNARQGSINDIPLEDTSIDLVYSRHILEHLSFYEKAISEVVRVARKEALIIFFIEPLPGKEKIIYDSKKHFYNNQYDKNKIEKYVLSLDKVSHIEWEKIPHNEIMLHIFLK